MAQNLFVMTYHIFNHRFVRYHDSLESVRRDACDYIIIHGIKELDIEEYRDHHEIAEKFLALVVSGDLDQAIRYYQTMIDQYGWDESVEVSTVTLSDSSDIQLLAHAKTAEERLLGAEPESYSEESGYNDEGEEQEETEDEEEEEDTGDGDEDEEDEEDEADESS